jgi:hypothetical protein
MGSKLIWLLIVVVLIAILSSLFKVKEGFRKSNRGGRKNKPTKTKSTLKIKVDGDNSSKTASSNSLNIINGNVVVPDDATIEFGGGINGKEINAGKIKYGGWDATALNIVGAGADAGRRAVRVWDKLRVGPLEIQEDGCIGYGPDKKFTLCLQEDGNVVQYKDKKPVWATGIPS